MILQKNLRTLGHKNLNAMSENNPQQSTTYGNQHKLPRLPLPKIEETLPKFLKAVKPLLTSSEFQQAEHDVSQFLTGTGKDLQKLLEEYNNTECLQRGFHSYVEEFWSDAYLAPDNSVVLNLNPFFLLEEHPDPKVANNQIHRAASLLFSSLKFASMLKSETLTPDTFRGRPLCMDQFKAIFGSCRIPVENGKDYVEHYPESTHVVVMHRGQMYYFQALWPDGNGTLAVDIPDIVEILTAIHADDLTSTSTTGSRSSHGSGEPSLGVLTTMKRGAWSAVRNKIQKSSEQNESALRVIDEALFVLVLDDFIPRDIHEAAANMLHGSYKLSSSPTSTNDNDIHAHDHKFKQTKSIASAVCDHQIGTCCNRWYDKLQIIVCADGSAGVNFEHSAIDGHTALRFVSDIFADTVVSFAQSITKSVYGASDRVPSVLRAPVKRASAVQHVLADEAGVPVFSTQPKRIEFDVDVDVHVDAVHVLDQIHYAETAVGDEICGLETRVLKFCGYGKCYIVANKMSPDSFVQMAILLAYYRMYGSVVCSYESVLTKGFLHGRTEAMRSTTPEAVSFCHAFCSRLTSREDKIAALREAVRSHSALVKEAAAGKGADRHLYALKCIASKCQESFDTQNSLFSSDAWKVMNRTILSTSNCGNPSLELFGFGPVVPDGFGIGYIIKDNGISYTVTSKHRQTQRFVQMLQNTLESIQEMLRIGSSESSSLQVSRHHTANADAAAAVSCKESVQTNGNGISYLEDYDFYGETKQLLSPRTSELETSDASLRSLSSSSEYVSNVMRKQSLDLRSLQNVGVNVSSTDIRVNDD